MAVTTNISPLQAAIRYRQLIEEVDKHTNLARRMSANSTEFKQALTHINMLNSEAHALENRLGTPDNSNTYFYQSYLRDIYNGSTRVKFHIGRRRKGDPAMSEQLDPKRILYVYCMVEVNGQNTSATVRFPLLGDIDRVMMAPNQKYQLMGFAKKDRLLVVRSDSTGEQHAFSYGKHMETPSQIITIDGTEYSFPQAIIEGGETEEEQPAEIGNMITLWGESGGKRYPLLAYHSGTNTLQILSPIPLLHTPILENFLRSGELGHQFAIQRLTRTMSRASEQDQQRNRDRIVQLGRELQQLWQSLSITNTPKDYLEAILARIKTMVEEDKTVHAFWFDADGEPKAIIGPVAIKTVTKLEKFENPDVLTIPHNLGYFLVDLQRKKVKPLNFNGSNYNDYHPNVRSSICFGTTDSLYHQLMGQGQYDSAVRLVLTALERVDGSNPHRSYFSFPPALTNWAPTEDLIREIMSGFSPVISYTNPIPGENVNSDDVETIKKLNYTERREIYTNLYEKFSSYLSTDQQRLLVKRFSNGAVSLEAVAKSENMSRHMATQLEVNALAQLSASAVGRAPSLDLAPDEDVEDYDDDDSEAEDGYAQDRFYSETATFEPADPRDPLL